MEQLFQSYRDNLTPEFDEEYSSERIIDYVDKEHQNQAREELYELRRNIAFENFEAGFRYAIKLLIK